MNEHPQLLRNWHAREIPCSYPALGASPSMWRTQTTVEPEGTRVRLLDSRTPAVTPDFPSKRYEKTVRTKTNAVSPPPITFLEIRAPIPINIWRWLTNVNYHKVKVRLISKNTTNKMKLIKLCKFIERVTSSGWLITRYCNSFFSRMHVCTCMYLTVSI